MNMGFLLLKIALFIALVPGVLISIPADQPFKVQAVVHGLIFAVLIYFLWTYLREGFSNPDTRINPKCPQGYEQNKNGDCFLKSATPQEFL